MSLLSRLFPFAGRRRALRELGAEFVRNGRDEFLFVEGDKQLPIYAELQGGGDFDFVVDEDNAVGNWLPPHQSEPLDDVRKREILGLFLQYLAIFDYRVQCRSGGTGSTPTGEPVPRS